MKPNEETLDYLLNIMPAVLYEYIQNQDGTNIITYISPNSIDILGYPSSRFINKDISSFLEITHEEDSARLEKEDRETINDSSFTTEARIIWPTEEIRWIRFRSKPASRSSEDTVTWVGCIVDITELKQSQAELKQLRGILPLCSFCKKIRNDKGYWTQVDHYIMEHTDADISHSICPECLIEKYPEVD